MKQKLSFQLFKNNKLIINEDAIDYCQNGQIIDFIIDSEKYILECSLEKCYFCRYNDEFSFTISIKSDIKTINYSLSKEKQNFNLNYKYLKYKFQNDEINIYFNLESDEEDSRIRVFKKEEHHEK